MFRGYIRGYVKPHIFELVTHNKELLPFYEPQGNGPMDGGWKEHGDVKGARGLSIPAAV